jgi:hypothetical protein
MSLNGTVMISLGRRGEKKSILRNTRQLWPLAGQAGALTVFPL